MGIAVIVVTGIVVVSLISVVGDYLSKKNKAKFSAPSPELRNLNERIEALEKEAMERETRIQELEGEVAFNRKLLDKPESE